MHSSAALDPPEQRRFAVEVVRALRAKGHAALFAGGCVRDQLLGHAPTDYDVATDAAPEQIRALFGPRRTLPIGAAFGVIAVVGPKPAGIVEVATFRRDLGYSDGRRPDAVQFCTPELDAQRRDFTINGMFFDPLADRVIDYVGGQADLAAGIIRAIGEPAERFAEDQLRLLRAVRFTARFGFQLDPRTQRAIAELAPKIVNVSAERIAAELRAMLALPRRAQAVTLLRETNLLDAIFSEWPQYLAKPGGEAAWKTTCGQLAALSAASFPLALAVLLAPLSNDTASTLSVAARETARKIGKRLKLANDEIDSIEWLLEHTHDLNDARNQKWSRLQPLLIHPCAAELVDWHMVSGALQAADDAEFCRQKLALPRAALDPPPLVTGRDLIARGLKPGEEFARLLAAARAAQLDGEVNSTDEALDLLARMKEGRLE